MARDEQKRPERTALVLQGGGALGVYQVGVFQALEEHGFLPNWIAGTSIGAINGAIIAGNAPEQRLERLEEFWRAVSTQDFFGGGNRSTAWRQMDGFYNALGAVCMGLPNFFRPRVPLNPFHSHRAENASFYDTAPLRALLERLIDFDRLNDPSIRLSVGAVSVTQGAMRYFDTQTDRLGPEHIMASGALPPGFPPVRIDGELFWDGGLYSNTPLDAVLEDYPRVNTLCFAVNLWNKEGPEPRSLLDVFAREKEIRYASRFRNHVNGYRELHNMRRAIRALYKALPEEKQALPEFRELARSGCHTTMDIVRLGRATNDWELSSKDVNFAWPILEERWRAGYRDATGMLLASPWKESSGPHTGVVVHELPEGAPEIA